MSVAYWVCAGFTVASAAVSLGFSIAGVAVARGEGRTPSLYAAARSIALFAVAVLALCSNAIPFVVAVSIAMVIVQALDAIVGFIIRNRVKTMGPAATALLGLLSLLWLLSA